MLDGDIVFDVERILDHRLQSVVVLQYLVKWEGYGSEHDSWEPEVNLRGAHEPLALCAECLRSNGQTLTSTQEDSGAAAASEKRILTRACAGAFWQQPEAERHSVWCEASLVWSWWKSDPRTRVVWCGFLTDPIGNAPDVCAA